MVKPSQNTQTPTVFFAWSASLIDPTIEYSYDRPGERKQLLLSTKPNSNSNRGLPITRMNRARN
jgi:hypothetical protein